MSKKINARNVSVFKDVSESETLDWLVEDINYEVKNLKKILNKRKGTKS